MISITDSLPLINKDNAELIKIKCLWDSYRNDNTVMFWRQNENKALISLTDGNMIIFNNGLASDEIQELKEFVSVLNPACIYSDYKTLCDINKEPREKINIMYRKADIEGKSESDILKSDELYSLLDVKGLSLPSYPYFAVDYCKRLNSGFADYFAIKNKCAVISFNSGGYAIINGIASHEKGYGNIALKGILQKNFGRKLFVCCRDKVKGFYEKNDFIPLYFGGYWVKSNEYK